MSPPNPEPPASRASLVLAFAAVYLVWGSTYLAIRIAVGGLPAFLMGGVRFVVSGLVLLPFLLRRGDTLPTPRQWRNAVIVGCLLMLGGNGLVIWAEQTVTSSQAALFIASTPVWFTVFDWVRPGGTRPNAFIWLGIALGFAGVVALVSDHGARAADIPVPQSIALVGATMCWAAGSIFTRHSDRPKSPLMGAAAQMVCGGIAMIGVGLARGETRGFRPDAVPAGPWLALAYLVVFGSLVGYTAYVYLLRHCTPSRVSTYAYVNPLIAVVLGAVFLGETLGPRARIAGALVLSGVVLLTLPPATWVRIVGRAARGLPFRTSPP